MGIYDAAWALGYSAFHVRDLVQRRMIRASKVKGAWVIPDAEVERLRARGAPLTGGTTRPAVCAAPDCGRVLAAVGRQRYCSKTCQHRTYMRQRRAAA